MTTAEGIQWLGGHALAGEIRRKSVSPVEAVDAALAQLEKVEPHINAFVTVTAERAREEARAAERLLMTEDPDKLPPLFGVTLSVKDLVDTAGVRTTYGAPEFADHVPSADGIAFARLRAAGAILIGKTTTPEFGKLGVTESGLTGITGNPWNPAYTAGGSSGGAAAAVAAGVGALAWGSDAGGSVRVPASACGVVGLKPSMGRIPNQNPWVAERTQGGLTRNVVDTALMLQVAAGPAPSDPQTLPLTSDNYVAAALNPRPPANVRIGYAAAPAGGLTAREVAEITERAVRTLETIGMHVEAFDLILPDPIEYFVNFWGPGIARVEKQPFAMKHPAMLDMVTRAGSALNFYETFFDVRPQLTRAYQAAFERFDYIVTPTMTVAPFLHPGDAGGNTHVDGVPVAVPSIDFHRYTESPTHAGLPAISVPAGFSADGLPIGLQIIGNHLDDVGVISVAAHLERLLNWEQSRPSMSQQ